LKKLAAADAFGSLPLGRRPALWQSLPQGEPLPLFDLVNREQPPASLPPMSAIQEVVADYNSIGLTLRQHPMSFLRSVLDDLKVVPASQFAALPSGRRVKAAGIVLLRQRPSTAKGITFVTLEDETGMINLIIRQEIWERYRRAARTASVMLVHGTLQKEVQARAGNGKTLPLHHAPATPAPEIIHVLVSRIEDLSLQLAQLTASSRDFR
jgi:error-prone DNA polymerase